MYSVSQKSVSYVPFGKIPAPTVNKSAASKKDLSLAVNDETLEKMRQLGYKDAKSGNQLCGSEYFSLLNQCREKIAPDRSRIYAEAESKMRSICRKLQSETGNVLPIFDYIFKAEKKDKEYHILDTSGSVNGGGSFVGRCTSIGCINIHAYDENGEYIGFYYSDGTKTYWDTIYTEAENECIHALSAAYAEGTNAYYAEEKAEGQALREKILSSMDYYA